MNFGSGLRLEFMYISQYNVEPHSSTWFSAACTAAVAHRNHCFHLYQQKKSSESKVKFRHAGNHCEKVLEAGKLPYAVFSI